LKVLTSSDRITSKLNSEKWDAMKSHAWSITTQCFSLLFSVKCNLKHSIVHCFLQIWWLFHSIHDYQDLQSSIQRSQSFFIHNRGGTNNKFTK
jgi:hypothetical protein